MLPKILRRLFTGYALFSLLVASATTQAELLSDLSQPETVFEKWVPYGRRADGSWAMGKNARQEWWAVDEGALRGQNFPDEKHPAGLSWKGRLPATLNATGARISWRLKVTDTSRGTLRIFGITSGPFEKEGTDHHQVEAHISKAGLRLFDAHRELTGPAPDKASRKFQRSGSDQKAENGVTPGTWHTLTMELKGTDARLFLNGQPALTLKLSREQPIQTLSLEADGDKKTAGLVWFSDVAVDPLPAQP